MDYTGFQTIERTDVWENDTRRRISLIVRRREYLIGIVSAWVLFDTKYNPYFEVVGGKVFLNYLFY